MREVSEYVRDPDDFALIVPPERLLELTGLEGWGFAIVRGERVSYGFYPVGRIEFLRVAKAVGGLPTCPMMPWSDSVAVIEPSREVDLLVGLARHFRFHLSVNDDVVPALPGFHPASPVRAGDLLVRATQFGLDVRLKDDLGLDSWLSGKSFLTLHLSDDEKRLALVKSSKGVPVRIHDGVSEVEYSIPGLPSWCIPGDWIAPEYRVIGNALVFSLENARKPASTIDEKDVPRPSSGDEPELVIGPGTYDIRTPVPSRGMGPLESLLLLLIFGGGVAYFFGKDIMEFLP